jgi:hypothetical protein
MVGLFREGKESPSLSCPLGAGAAHTVWEPDKAKIRFAKYRDRDLSAFKQAAE